MATNAASKTFSVTLNGVTHWATYTIEDDVVTVVSEHGTASASASEESNFSTAITLLFGILRAAD